MATGESYAVEGNRIVGYDPACRSCRARGVPADARCVHWEVPGSALTARPEWAKYAMTVRGAQVPPGAEQPGNRPRLHLAFPDFGGTIAVDVYYANVQWGPDVISVFVEYWWHAAAGIMRKSIHGLEHSEDLKADLKDAERAIAFLEDRMQIGRPQGSGRAFDNVEQFVRDFRAKTYSWLEEGKDLVDLTQDEMAEQLSCSKSTLQNALREYKPVLRADFRTLRRQAAHEYEKLLKRAAG